MDKFENTKENRKQIKKYIKLGVLAVVVVLLAVMPMLAASRESEDDTKASVLTATVTYQNIDTRIIGGGQLSSEASLNVRIPENVKLRAYLVGNGDTVKEGDVIASVDKVSVMTAITQVQETLDYLTDEIADVSGNTAATSVKALAGGTVKVIYAREGESVQDVMLDHGALAVLSLDDTMAVKIEKATALDVGDRVCVTLPDGTAVDGRVKTNLEGVLTITMDDDDYSVGSTVTVTTDDGSLLGTGELYIFSPWNATAYSGTVQDILVKENETVYVGRTLLSLEDTGNSAQFQRLIDQRQEYEELMQELFTMYRTQTITAPCDGIVAGVDEDGAYLLAAEDESWFPSLLSVFRKRDNDGFRVYAARVTEVTGDGMTLQLDPTGECVEDLSDLLYSADLAAMTESWNYSGDITVYTQDERGLLQRAGDAMPGDVLLAVGDEAQVHWFVRAETVNDGGVDPDSQTGAELLSSMTAAGFDIALKLDTVSGVAGDAFIGSLTAWQGESQLSGTWEVVSSDANFFVSVNGGVISAVPQKAGTYVITATFKPQSAEEDETEFPWAYFVITIAEPYSITTDRIPDGQKGVPYENFTMTASGGSGTWRAENLPAGLVMSEGGVIAGTPTMTGAFTVKVYYSFTQNGVKKEKSREYTVEITSGQQPGQDGGTAGAMGGSTMGGGTMSGGTGGSMGGISGGSMIGGAGQTGDENLYTRDKLTIASVTSQEHMTVSITIDELDITSIYVGQEAVVSVDALGGEQFEAQITQISNSGENEGGNSKFTVELTLGKSGDMLPGMYSSAFITLKTREAVPCLPVAALHQDGVQTVVYTSYDPDSGILGDPVEVTIGCSDGENVEIVAGLEPGTTCYYEYYDTYIGSDASSQQSGSFSFGSVRGGAGASPSVGRSRSA